MGSDDFISLESPSPSISNDKDNGEIKEMESRNTGTVSPARVFHVKLDPCGSDNSEAIAGHGDQGDDPNVLDMDLEDDIPQQPPVLYERTVLFRSSTVEQCNVGSKQVEDAVADTNLNNGTSKKHLLDESSIAGVKRARVAYIEKQPSVRVIFSSLTRESKRKLMELMQQWSQWQAKHQLSSSEFEDVFVENGEETYFPALHVGSRRSDVVSFWVDNQARQEVDKDKTQYDAEVPLYDREYMLGSTSVGGSNGPDGIETLGASRCFNCGSYSHALKECPRPRDNIAISNARKMHNSRRNQTAGTRLQARYYQKTPGKFDDLRAGVLGPETRECLGIGEHDPPPWLNRMREIGYPPGYMDVENEDQPSGITIYADEEAKEEATEEYEDGELPERSEPEPPQKKMTVEFPGINAPIPENADHRRWAASSTGSGSNSFRNRTHHPQNHSSDHNRGNYYEQKRSLDLRDDGMRDVEHMYSSSYPGYSPRYSPYNSLGRSLSDRGWRSPLHETSPTHSPHSPHLFSSSQQSPRDQYHSRSHDYLSNESSNSRMPDSSSERTHDKHHHRYHNWR
ncbi:zinc finger CCHC domain-containing protein 8 [Canna indica]|uniref:Zinc finger CCHC domain-containing protein 8 n=1 Tax=Canna indica TaxID=4628 RepID=A0AAQ3JSV8_9LILI|nr:zinc finger CCHC domain-containing protein 8 [Canna indica]